ncbi:MAG: HEAT repeat domain-containing protein [Armatimonadota bacterium]
MGIKRLHLFKELLVVLSVLGLLAWLVYFLLFRPLPPAQQESLSDLQRQFNLTDQQERIKAIEAMGARYDLPVLPILTGALKEKDPAIRAAAAKALGRRQDPQALPALLEAWDAANRAWQAHPLDSVDLVSGDHPEHDAYTNLTGALQMLDPLGLPALQAESKSSDPAVRRRAARILILFHSREAQAVLLAATRDADPGVRAAAAGSFDYPYTEQKFARLVELSNDPAPTVRRQAAENLGYWGWYTRSTQPLLRATRDRDALVRAAAYESLGNPRHASAFPVLVAGTREQDARARAAAVKGLGAFSDLRGQTAVRPLLRDPDKTVRLAALRAAGQLHDAASLPALDAALRRGPDQETRDAAAEGLAMLRGPGLARLAVSLNSSDVAVRRAVLHGYKEQNAGEDEDVDMLLARIALHDPDERLRQMAMTTLKYNNDKRLDAVMTKLLNDPKPWARREACQWFEQHLGNRAMTFNLHLAVPILLNRIQHGTAPDQRLALETYLYFNNFKYDSENGRAHRVLRTALGSPDHEMRRIALQHLAYTGAAKVLPDLQAMLRTGSPEERAFAADLLDRYLDQGAVRRLLLGALQDKDARVRAAALDSLPDEKRYFRLLVRYTRDADVRVRGNAIYKLGKINDRRAVPVLLRLLADRSNDYPLQPLRGNVVSALQHYKDPRTIGPLTALLNDMTESTVFNGAVQALQQIGSPAVKPLLQAARTLPPERRARIIESLGETKDSQALDAVRAALHDDGARVRSAAARALGELKDTASLPALRKLLDDRDEDVRISAALVLGGMKDRESVPKITALVRTLSGRFDNYPYATYLSALGEIGDPRAVPLLSELQRSADPEVSKWAADALKQIKAK